jgi:hypothetical protein
MRKSVFVLMPFSAEFDAAYNMFIKPGLEDIGFSIVRADDMLNQRNIMQDVISNIAEADLIVADLTGSNPNVFYELGIAHALEKPTILLTQSVEELPFDLRSYRVLVYQTHFAKIDNARKDLARLAKSAYEGTAVFGNPVTDFRAKSRGPISQSTEQLIKVSSAPEDDRGFIDHFIDMQEGYDEIAKLVGRSTRAVEELTPKTQELGDGITRARETGGQLASSQIRFLCQRYASSLEAYAAELQQVNDQYEKIADHIQNSLEFVVRSQRESQNDTEQLQTFIAVLKAARASIAGARDAYISARGNMVVVLNFERSVRRSGGAALSELDRLVSNFWKTIASIDRAIEAAGGEPAN